MVADLTDPSLSRDEANGIFQVLTQQFRVAQCSGGKLLVLDEAHKYMSGEGSDGLCKVVVEAARLMRHEGMRIAISTQSPAVLAPELLELLSLAVLHRFHSHDWFAYLKRKIPLEDEMFDELLEVQPGQALVFANRTMNDVSKISRLVVRPKITADRGRSKANV